MVIQIPYGIFAIMKHENTKQFIIEKTAPIFNKKGYTGTYLSDLTEATGLTKGGIYCNFKNKNEVAVEAFRYNLQHLTGRVQQEIAKAEKAHEKLIAFIHFYKYNYKQVFQNGGCAILNTSVDADDVNELLHKEAIKALLSWKNTIESIVKEGIACNQLKAIDPVKFSCKMIALVEGSIMLAKTLNKPEYLINNIEFLEKEIREIIN